MKLWTDDERPAPDESWTVAKTSQEAIEAINRAIGSEYFLADWRTFADEVSLDHDLGGDDTGMRVLDYMIENRVWPDTLTIHTSNPPARERMLRAANAEAPAWVEIYVRTW